MEKTVMKTVMIVDDEPDTLDVLASMIEHRYCVMQAQSGREALEQLKKKKPDLILIDFYMPEINGRELLKNIREDMQLKNIPVLMLSAAQLEPEKGVDGYITKPVTSKELLEPIEKIFKARA